MERWKRRPLINVAAATCAILAIVQAGSPAAIAQVDSDGVSAITTGARVDGKLEWLDYAGHMRFDVVVRDTLIDGHCANLYIRQRNINVSGGWTYFGHACGGGTATRLRGCCNRPFQGGTTGFDFKILRHEVNNYAIDANALGGS